MSEYNIKFFSRVENFIKKLEELEGDGWYGLNWLEKTGSLVSIDINVQDHNFETVLNSFLAYYIEKYDFSTRQIYTQKFYDLLYTKYDNNETDLYVYYPPNDNHIIIDGQINENALDDVLMELISYAS